MERRLLAPVVQDAETHGACLILDGAQRRHPEAVVAAASAFVAWSPIGRAREASRKDRPGQTAPLSLRATSGYPCNPA